MQLEWKEDTEYLRTAEVVERLSQLGVSGLIDLFAQKNASLKILVLDAKFVPAILEAHSSVDLTITAHPEGSVDHKTLKLVELETAPGLAEPRTACTAHDLILASKVRSLTILIYYRIDRRLDIRARALEKYLSATLAWRKFSSSDEHER